MVRKKEYSLGKNWLGSADGVIWDLLLWSQIPNVIRKDFSVSTCHIKNWPELVTWMAPSLYCAISESEWRSADGLQAALPTSFHSDLALLKKKKRPFCTSIMGEPWFESVVWLCSSNQLKFPPSPNFLLNENHTAYGGRLRGDRIDSDN